MRISVFGLGYVGVVVSACFARDGHEVIGVDTDATKVDMVASGRSPIIEKDLDDLLMDGVRAGRIRATLDAGWAIAESDLSMLCVGTPSRPTGELDLSAVARVCESIGAAIGRKATRHLVTVRSTMLPGSVEGCVIPTLEAASGRRVGAELGVAINPEFLREGSAIQDFFNPPKTVVGALDLEDARTVASLYASVEAPLILTSIRAAEMVKYADNTFHALKIAFCNEIGALCRSAGIDSGEIMEIFCTDRKLNLSPAYLRPGFAYGGSCLPKDLRAITRLAQSREIEVPLLSAIGVSNERQIQRAITWVLETGCRHVGVLGFAFKGGTDDLRESPVISLVETLLGKGLALQLYDRHVSLARLVGANRRYIEEHIPHISRLMVDSPADLIASAEVILVGNQDDAFDAVLAELRPDQRVLDLRPVGRPVSTAAAYHRLT